MPHKRRREQRRRSAFFSNLPVLVLLIVFAAQCLLSMRLKSPTFDEPTYLAAGYVALTTGVDLNPAHPHAIHSDQRARTGRLLAGC